VRERRCCSGDASFTPSWRKRSSVLRSLLALRAPLAAKRPGAATSLPHLLARCVDGGCYTVTGVGLQDGGVAPTRRFDCFALVRSSTISGFPGHLSCFRISSHVRLPALARSPYDHRRAIRKSVGFRVAESRRYLVVEHRPLAGPRPRRDSLLRKLPLSCGIAALSPKRPRRRGSCRLARTGYSGLLRGVVTDQ
jgi:hypothetical protein